MIPGENSQTAGENRKTICDAKFGREISDQEVVGSIVMFTEPGRFALLVSVEIVRDAIKMRQKPLVRGRSLQRPLINRPEHQRRVVARLFPQVAVPAEQFD